MTAYVALKRQIALRTAPPGTVADDRAVPLWGRVLAGAAANSLFWALAYPLDVCRTHQLQGSAIHVTRSAALMLQGSAIPLGGTSLRHPPPPAAGEAAHCTLLSAVRTLLAEGGLPRLYRGVGHAMLRAGPVSGVILPLYDVCLSALTPHEQAEGGLHSSMPRAPTRNAAEQIVGYEPQNVAIGFHEHLSSDPSTLADSTVASTVAQPAAPRIDLPRIQLSRDALPRLKALDLPLFSHALTWWERLQILRDTTHGRLYFRPPTPGKPRALHLEVKLSNEHLADFGFAELTSQHGDTQPPLAIEIDQQSAWSPGFGIGEVMARDWARGGRISKEGLAEQQTPAEVSHAHHTLGEALAQDWARGRQQPPFEQPFGAGAHTGAEVGSLVLGLAADGAISFDAARAIADTDKTSIADPATPTIAPPSSIGVANDSDLPRQTEAQYAPDELLDCASGTAQGVQVHTINRRRQAGYYGWRQAAVAPALDFDLNPQSVRVDAVEGFRQTDQNHDRWRQVAVAPAADLDHRPQAAQIAAVDRRRRTQYGPAYPGGRQADYYGWRQVSLSS